MALAHRSESKSRMSRLAVCETLARTNREYNIPQYYCLATAQPSIATTAREPRGSLSRLFAARSGLPQHQIARNSLPVGFF